MNEAIKPVDILQSDQWRNYKIDVPGIYDIPNAVYHNDPCKPMSLSAGGCVDIESRCAAEFIYDIENPEPVDKAAFHLGTVYHQMVLGDTSSLALVPFDNYNKKDAKTARDQAIADGLTPLTIPQHDLVADMVKAFRAHPFASNTIRHGLPEQSLFWFNEEFQIWCRARLDWLPDVSKTNIFPDIKSQGDISDDFLSKQAWNLGYYQRAAWYYDAIRALEIHENPALIYVFQKKKAPYLISHKEPSPEMIEAGRYVNRKSMRLFADGVHNGHWEEYNDGVSRYDLPGWADRQLQYRAEAGEFADPALDPPAEDETNE